MHDLTTAGKVRIVSDGGHGLNVVEGEDYSMSYGFVEVFYAPIYWLCSASDPITSAVIGNGEKS